MVFIHFGLRMEIEELYLKWCEEEGVANEPNSFVVFMMLKGWLNEEKIIEDLDHKTENSSEIPNNSTISKMEQVDKDINVRSKDEPQINASQHVQHVESVETMSCQECRRWIYDDRWGWFCPLKGQDECKYEPKDEPRTERSE